MVQFAHSCNEETLLITIGAVRTERIAPMAVEGDA